MQSNLLNRLLEGLGKQITQSAKFRLKQSFQGYSYLHSSRYDSLEIRKLIQQHNEKVKEYNSLGKQLVCLFIRKMDQFHPQPQDDLRGVFDEWLRLRSLNKHPELFKSVNTEMNRLEHRLAELAIGAEGIGSIRKSIDNKRKQGESRSGKS